MYHTYAHHDAAGTGTWTQVMSGHKFWVFIRNKDGYESCADRQQFYQLRRVYTLAESRNGRCYGQESNRYVVFAHPGDIMCSFSFPSRSLYSYASTVYNRPRLYTRYTPRRCL